MKWLLSLMLLALICPALLAQANGATGQNVPFDTTWYMPANHDESYDYLPANVIILEWWSTT